MGRRIVVMSNCQTGGLRAALAAMLPDDDVVALAWLDAEPPELRSLLATADVWVSSIPRAEAEAIGAAIGGGPELLTVPSLWFRGFHPDIVHATAADGQTLPSAAGPYHSALALWGWLHGHGPDDVLSWFTPATFAALGYTTEFAVQVERLRGRFDGTDVDFAAWYLPLVRRGAFMLTDNHPRLDALIGLARPVAARLGATPDALAFGWEQLLVDGLQATSVVWPLYPDVARSYALPGAYAWRAADGELLGLDAFVRRSFAGYAAHDPAGVAVARFDVDDRFDRVLGAAARPAADRAPTTADPAPVAAADRGGR